MCLSQAERIANIVEALATVVALGLGGVWSYWLFVKRRQRHPHAAVEHRIAHRFIGEGKVLLHVDVRITNIGQVLMSPMQSVTRIQRVLPLPSHVAEAIRNGRDPVPEGETEVEWELLDEHKERFERGACEIEPGESQDVSHDFILDTGLQTVEVYSYVLTEEDRETGLAWDMITLYDLSEEDAVLPHKEE